MLASVEQKNIGPYIPNSIAAVALLTCGRNMYQYSSDPFNILYYFVSKKKKSSHTLSHYIVIFLSEECARIFDNNNSLCYIYI